MTDLSATTKTVGNPPWQRLKLPAGIRWLRETISIVLWLVLLTHLFIVDLRPWPISIQLPEWMYTFRFLIIVGAVSASLLVLGARRFILFLGYIVFYPFVVLLWHLPRMVFRNWLLLVAFAPAIYSTVRAFKWRFASFAAALVCGAAILWGDSKLIIIGAMLYIGIYLAVHFVRRFNVAFSPDTVFTIWTDFIKRISATIGKDVYRRPDNLDPEFQEYQEKITQNLIGMYMLSSGLLYLAKGLRRVSESRKLDIYFISSLVYTFFLTTVVFSFEYLGLESTIRGSFVGIVNHSFVSFLGLSFITIFPSSISPLSGATDLAQIFRYAEHFAGFLIFILFAFVILTTIRERHKQDLDKVVGELSNTSERIGSYLLDNYKLTTAAVKSWIFKHNPTLIRHMLKLRYGDAVASQTIEALESAAGEASVSTSTEADSPAFDQPPARLRQGSE